MAWAPQYQGQRPKLAKENADPTGHVGQGGLWWVERDHEDGEVNLLFVLNSDNPAWEWVTPATKTRKLKKEK